jgi:hypothetical protein
MSYFVRVSQLYLAHSLAKLKEFKFAHMEWNYHHAIVLAMVNTQSAKSRVNVVLELLGATLLVTLSL